MVPPAEAVARCGAATPQVDRRRRAEADVATHTVRAHLLDLFVSSEAVFPMFFCRLAAMNRELKLKDLQLMDATRRKFLEYQQQQKEMELARMDDEIRRKVR